HQAAIVVLEELLLAARAVAVVRRELGRAAVLVARLAATAPRPDAKRLVGGQARTRRVAVGVEAMKRVGGGLRARGNDRGSGQEGQEERQGHRCAMSTG